MVVIFFLLFFVFYFSVNFCFIFRCSFFTPLPPPYQPIHFFSCPIQQPTTHENKKQIFPKTPPHSAQFFPKISAKR